MKLQKLMIPAALLAMLVGCGSTDHYNVRGSKSVESGAEMAAPTDPVSQEELEDLVDDEIAIAPDDQIEDLKQALLNGSSNDDQQGALSLRQRSSLQEFKQRMMDQASERASILEAAAKDSRIGYQVVGYVGVGAAVLTNRGLCGVKQIYEIGPFFHISLVQSETVFEGACDAPPRWGVGVAGVGAIFSTGHSGLGYAGVAASSRGICIAGRVYVSGLRQRAFGSCSNW